MFIDKIYQEKTNGIRIRSKCNWYEHGEKSSKFFLNLEKSCAVQNQIRNVLIDKIEITKKILTRNSIYVIKISLIRDNTYQNMA